MNELAIILVIISAAMHALRNFLTKKAIDKEAFVWWYEVLGDLYFLPLFIFFLYQKGFPPLHTLPFVVLSATTHFLYWLFLAKTLEHGELSQVYPIMRSSPALILVLSVLFLGEEVSFLGVIGILLVSFGVYTINLKKISFSDFLKPILEIRSNRAVQFAFLTLLSVTAYSIADKLGVEQIHPFLFAGLYHYLGLTFFTGYIFKIKNKQILKHEWKTQMRPLLICGFLGVFGYLLILIAFSFERVSYIVGLRQLSIVFAVLLGAHFLKEKNQGIRLFASIVIFGGTFAIVMAK